MRIDILTLFPQMFSGPLTESILQRASSVARSGEAISRGEVAPRRMEDKQDEKPIRIVLHDLREFGIGKYRQVDDSPYGGGAGMVLRCDVVVAAIEAVMGIGKNDQCSMTNDQSTRKNQKIRKSELQKPHRIYLSPRGKRLTQTRVERLAKKHDWLLLLCGHYEGIDQRVIDGGWIDEEVSIGDYVLTGGELPAMVLVDAVARQIPGVLGKDESAAEESFSKTLDRKREYPHFTRPEEFRGLSVPDVLRGGHHAEIEKWRRKNLQ